MEVSNPEMQETCAEFSLDFPYSLDQPPHAMGFRTSPGDFQVTENLGFTPAGEGEHVLFHIRKTGQNTRWVAHQLASFFGVAEGAVGYCGLKDRWAVTTQWFSVHLPGKYNGSTPAIEGCEILNEDRHTRKLKPGMHRDNIFLIILRGTGKCQADLERRLGIISKQGVPNYFGEQRFGKNANNLFEVKKILSAKRPRFGGKRGGLYLSAARSWLFNQVLANRVLTGSWQTCHDGPLWGRGRPLVEAALALEEQEILGPWSDWCYALEHSGLKQERRTLVLRPAAFQWKWDDLNLELEFALPPGGYATSLLRELAQLRLPVLAG